MTTKPYKTRKGITQFKPVLSTDEYRTLEEECEGFCLACGETQYGCEPDARQYACESCKEKKVYGLPELLMMGLVILTDGAEDED